MPKTLVRWTFALISTLVLLWTIHRISIYPVPGSVRQTMKVAPLSEKQVHEPMFKEHHTPYLGQDLGENSKLYNKALRKHNAVVLSVCNTVKHRFCNFVKSAHSYGALLHLIEFGSTWHRNTDKLFAMYEAVKRYTNDTIIIFSDCMDVVFNDEMENTLARFKEKKVNMMISVEYACWPDDVILKLDPSINDTKDGCIRAYDMVGSQNTCVKRGPRYVNSGTYIGYAGILKELLRDVCDEITNKGYKGYSDQKYFHEAHLLGKYGMQLDYCVEFFMGMLFIETSCLPNCPWARRNYDYMEYVPTKSRPSFVHFQYDTKTTIYDKYINESMVVRTPRHAYNVPMFWVNKEPRKIEDFCPS